MINSKKQLAIALSGLQVFTDADIRLEQYPTDSEVAAEVLWFAQQNGDIEDKIIADLGAGTGVLGIGCMFFEPKKVIFVEKDKKAIKILEENLFELQPKIKSKTIHSDIMDFNEKVDLIIQNPPFGVKNRKADKPFLEKAFSVADVIYSFHKPESKKFIDTISKENKFDITNYFEFDFPLKQTMKFHKKRITRIRVGCWRMERKA